MEIVIYQAWNYNEGMSLNLVARLLTLDWPEKSLKIVYPYSNSCLNIFKINKDKDNRRI